MAKQIGLKGIAELDPYLQIEQLMRLAGPAPAIARMRVSEIAAVTSRELHLPDIDLKKLDEHKDAVAF